MRLVASLSLFVLAACGPNPCPSTAVTPDVPGEFGALYNSFDADRLVAMFPADRLPNVAMHRENFAALRAQLGECGAPQFMWRHLDATRWTYPCDRGNLEISYALDTDGHIARLRSFAAGGVPANPAMDAAARSLLAELPVAADDTRPYRSNLSDPQVRALGRCELVAPWAVSSRLSLFHARCEGGEDVVLGVRMHKGKITRVKLAPGSLYKGMPM